MSRYGHARGMYWWLFVEVFKQGSTDVGCVPESELYIKFLMCKIDSLLSFNLFQ
jgi:hypothetical protein